MIIIWLSYRTISLGEKKEEEEPGNSLQRQVSMMITNQEFNDNIEEFVELVLENLQLLNSATELLIRNYYIKHLPFEKIYSFISFDLNTVRLNFTISYHDYYQVPVINCRLYENGKFIVGVESQTVLTISTNTSVELENHHLLEQPWLQIHPCETQHTIDEHLRDASQNKKCNHVIEYMCCWFGLYGLPSVFPQFSFRPSIYS